MTPVEQLQAISDKVHLLVAEEDRLFQEELLPALAAAGISFLQPAAFTTEQKSFGRNHFINHVFPALTPLAVDPGHPFPHLRNRSLTSR